jgi:Ca2+-binding RTX toxin-like protein
VPGNSYILFNLAASGVADYTFNAAGTRLYVSTSSGQIKVYDIATRALLHTWTVGTQLGAITLSDDDNWLLATERTNAGQSIIYRVDATTGAAVSYSLTGTVPFADVQAIDATRAILTGVTTTPQILDFVSGTFSPLSNAVYYANNSILTRSGQYTLFGERGISNGPMAIYNNATGAMSAFDDNYDISSGFNWGVQAISANGGLFARYIYYNTIVIQNLALQNVLTISANTGPGPIGGMAFSPDGQFFYYVHVDNGQVVKLETTGWTTVATYFTNPGGWPQTQLGSELSITPDGKYIIYRDVDTGDLNMIDLTPSDETFLGTAGIDNMAGGPGDDVYFVNLAGDVVTENPFEGNDTVYSSASSFTLGANIERLILEVGGINGAGNALNNLLTGNGGANTLNGGDGDDILIGDAGDDVLQGGNGGDNLNGGAGVDIMTGGAGDDVYIVDTIDDLVFENAGEGNDVVYTSGNYTLRGGVAVEVLLADAPAATTAINLSGNEFNNAITGNAGANILLGNGGDDALIGLGGNDNLDGGIGLDITNGGFGDDVHIVDSASDIVIEAAGQGRDLVYASASFALRSGDSVELLLTTNQAGTQAINLSGNEIDNIIQGNQGNNIVAGGGGADVLLGFGGDDNLDGGSGADILNGGFGDDIYFVDTIDDIILENNGEGRDIIYASANYILRSGVSIEFLIADPQSSTAAINLSGNEFANTILGNAGANILFGGGGNDTILGYAGNDTINGDAGDDNMIGGQGDDVYFINSAGDVVTELPNEGQDFIYTSISYTLGGSDYVEVLIADPAAGAFAQINLTGNGIHNNIQGNSADNILSGGGGGDVLVGNDGNDTLIGGWGQDILTGGTGADRFVINSINDFGTDVDTFTDFTPGADLIALSNGSDVFGTLTEGALPASAFVTGTAAQDADDRIIYDPATGRLYYDADGNGAGAAIHFATLSGNPTITASDFIVV